MALSNHFSSPTEVLDLSGNTFSGFLPPEIVTFTGIQNLTISNNFLSGPVPIELGSLVSLGKSVLDVCDCICKKCTQN